MTGVTPESRDDDIAATVVRYFPPAAIVDITASCSGRVSIRLKVGTAVVIIDGAPGQTWGHSISPGEDDFLTSSDQRLDSLEAALRHARDRLVEAGKLKPRLGL